jgi:hypothetical protein
MLSLHNRFFGTITFSAQPVTDSPNKQALSRGGRLKATNTIHHNKRAKGQKKQVFYCFLFITKATLLISIPTIFC